MAPNTSIVNINGNKYDTKTGKLLNSSPSAKATAGSAPKGLVMDGVMKRPTIKQASPKTTVATSAYKQGSIVKQAPASKAKPAKNVHSRLTRSNTLIRKALSKPTPPKPIHSQSKTPKSPAQITHATNQTSTIDQTRLNRAKTVSKSTLVTKFSTGTFKPKTTQENSKNQAIQGEVVSQSIAKSTLSQQQSQSTVLPSTISSATHGNIDELVDRALATATAHKEKQPKKKLTRPRLVSAMAVVLFIFVIGGFFAYQYVPNFAMRVASQRAGIDADLPNYQPSGFSFDSINATPGTVVVSYKSNTDDNRAYIVKQKDSNWDSQSLLSNFVKFEDSNYQQDTSNAGRVMYIYDNNNATWVSGGIWYIVEGNKANLTVDQLTKIASSM